MTGPDYDPYSWEVQDDPYPVYAWLRRHAPVYRSEQRDCWVLSRHADVLAALRDRRYSNRNGVSLDPSSWGPKARRTSSFLAMDPPEHSAMRGLVSAAFTPRRVTALEPRIRELARARLAPLLEQEAFDFAAGFAAPFPLDVICELTGVPPADRDGVRAAADLLTYREDRAGDRGDASARAGLQLHGYYTDLVAGLRQNPGSDLTSALTKAEHDGAGLSDSQIVSVLFLIIAAGNESTGKLLTNAWYQGALHPQARRDGLGGRAAGWAEETLRYDPSGQLMARTLTDRVTLHGTVMPEGSRVALLPASANRDEQVFPDADRFDLDRDTSQAIAFGHGPHYCLGAALARLEARIALQELGAAVADYGIDADAAVRSRWPHGRGFTSLPCTITRRRQPARIS